MIEFMTIDVVLLSICIIFLLGRMTKTPVTTLRYVDRDKIVEKKIEVPKEIYKCSHDCEIKLAQSLYDKTIVEDWSAESIDEQNEMHDKRLIAMDKCVEMAMKIHKANNQ